MIICICSNVSEKQVKDLLPLPVEQIMLKTDAGMCCGTCMKRLMEVVETEQGPAGQIRQSQQS